MNRSPQRDTGIRMLPETGVRARVAPSGGLERNHNSNSNATRGVHCNVIVFRSTETGCKVDSRVNGRESHDHVAKAIQNACTTQRNEASGYKAEYMKQCTDARRINMYNKEK